MAGAAAQLPRGRHEYSREAVMASQRSRLLDGVAAAVATKGYAATTVADVVAQAAVSRRTFYEQFEDLEECFLVAYESGMELLLEEIRVAVRDRPGLDWQERARAAVAAYLRALAQRPDAAWAFSIEAMGAGPTVLAHRGVVMRRWVKQWRELQAIAHAEDRAVADTSPDELLVLVGGIEELVRDCLRTRGAKFLPKLTDRVTDIAVAMLAGRSA